MIGQFSKQNLREINESLGELGIAVNPRNGKLISGTEVLEIKENEIIIEIERWGINGFRLGPDTSIEILKEKVKKLPRKRVTLLLGNDGITYEIGGLNCQMAVPPAELKLKKTKKILRRIAMVEYLENSGLLTQLIDSTGKYIAAGLIVTGKLTLTGE